MESYDVVGAGVDWITCSAKPTGLGFTLDRFSSEVLYQKRAAGEHVQPAARFGFRGFKTDHFFAGSNETGSVVIVSGAECVPLARDLITRADNVSRLDLQVTIATGGSQPRVGADAYRRARARHIQSGQRRTLALRQGYPDGETFTCGQRVSDFYARIYDKSAESGIGPARTIWRYEVEVKRGPAKILATEYADQHHPLSWVTHRVHQLMTARLVDCEFEPLNVQKGTSSLVFSRQAGDRLRWFRETVRGSVGLAIKSHGLEAVIEALGLSPLVDVKP